MFYWIDHNKSFSSRIELGCLYLILTNQNTNKDLIANQIAGFISNPKRVPTTSLSSPLATFLNIIGAWKLNGDCEFKLVSEDSKHDIEWRDEVQRFNFVATEIVWRSLLKQCSENVPTVLIFYAVSKCLTNTKSNKILRSEISNGKFFQANEIRFKQGSLEIILYHLFWRNHFEGMTPVRTGYINVIMLSIDKI